MVTVAFALVNRPRMGDLIVQRSKKLKRTKHPFFILWVPRGTTIRFLFVAGCSRPRGIGARGHTLLRNHFSLNYAIIYTLLYRLSLLLLLNTYLFHFLREKIISLEHF